MNEPQPPGRRDPRAAARGVAAVALSVEGVVLLLAIQPIRVLGGRLPGLAVAVVVTLAVACFALVAQLRRRWSWPAAGALQAALFVAGIAFHAALSILGVIFGLLWLYVLHVRRVVLR